MLGALPLSVTDWFEAHQVAVSARPRWIKWLIAMESAYRVHIHERSAPQDEPQEDADGVA